MRHTKISTQNGREMWDIRKYPQKVEEKRETQEKTKTNNSRKNWDLRKRIPPNGPGIRKY